MADSAREGDGHPQQGVPEPVVDHSALLTRPVHSDLLREVSMHPDKMEQLRLVVSQHLDMTIEELQGEISKVYGRRMTLQETLAIREMLS